MEQQTTRIGFVGSGNIAGPYAASIARHPELRLTGVLDVDRAKAALFADEHDCTAFESLEALATGVDLVVNLTSAPYHYATTLELLGHGVPVFSEKPIALSYDQARELVAVAEKTGTPLAAAPSLWLGSSYTEAAQRIRQGEIGAVRIVTAEVHQGRIESWHPAPHSFYQVGPVADVGVYPLTYLTAVLGPIRQVSATSVRALPQRSTKDGETFEIGVDDVWFITAVFESGAVLRLSCDYYIASQTVPRSMDLHGDNGSMRIDDWILPDALIERADFGAAYVAEPAGDKLELDWSLGVLDFARSMRAGVAHRNSPSHAAHVVEVLQAVATSAAEGRLVAVTSDFISPFAAAD